MWAWISSRSARYPPPSRSRGATSPPSRRASSKRAEPREPRVASCSAGRERRLWSRRSGPALTSTFAVSSCPWPHRALSSRSTTPREGGEALAAPGCSTRRRVRRSAGPAGLDRESRCHTGAGSRASAVRPPDGSLRRDRRAAAPLCCGAQHGGHSSTVELRVVVATMRVRFPLVAFSSQRLPMARPAKARKPGVERSVSGPWASPACRRSSADARGPSAA